MSPSTTQSPRRNLLALFGRYAIAYLAAYGLFDLFGLERSLGRPLAPVLIVMLFDYWESRRAGHQNAIGQKAAE